MRAAIVLALALALGACVERRTYQVADGGVDADDPATATLTVTRSGRGVGTITSEPGGIDCGATCEHAYPIGTVVTLTATSAPGSVVSGWSYAGCTRATCTVTLDAAVELTASFDTEPTYPLIVTREGPGVAGGTVRSTPTGIDCGATCAADFPQGATVELTPSTTAGTVFVRWSGGCTGSGPCVVTMDAAQEVKATFGVAALYNLQVLVGGSGSGAISVAPPGTSCTGPQACNSAHASGEAITLTATAQAGSQFAGWRGACLSFGLGATCQLTFASDSVTVLADFDACNGC